MCGYLACSRAKALFAPGGVKCDADEKQHHGKHDDAGKNVHL
jgi:hypothetical protein